MKIDLNNDEMAMLTAIMLMMSREVEDGFFDDMKEKDRQRTLKAFASLMIKVTRVNMEMMAGKDEAVDAELL